MTIMPIIDDTTYAVEIGIDAEEEALGVVGGRVIFWKRFTIYVYECADGRMASGVHVMNPLYGADRDLSRARARRKALDHLMKLRERLANGAVPYAPQRAASLADGGSR